MESWLFPDIPDFDASIQNYIHFQHDRNHHGGGIIVHVKSSFPLTLNFSFFSLSLNSFHSMLVHDFEHLADELVSLNSSVLPNFVVLVNFNVNYSDTSIMKHKIDIISDFLDLQQVIKEPTYFSCYGTPTIDLVFSLPQMLHFFMMPSLLCLHLITIQFSFLFNTHMSSLQALSILLTSSFINKLTLIVQTLSLTP